MDSVVDIDRDERRSARRFESEVHSPNCVCRGCQLEKSGLTDEQARGKPS